MSILLVILAFAGIGIIDLPGMIKSKRWRDFIVYLLIFLPVVVLGVLVAMEVNIPSPIKAIQKFYQEVLRLSFKPSK